MKLIELTQGKVALVDDEDFEKVNQLKWYVAYRDKKYWCPVRGIKFNGKLKMLYMSRFIMNVTDSKIYIDHINHDTLDNRKSNLRVCTHAENCYNQRKSKRSTSGYKGVSYHKHVKKWQAQICINYKYIHLGYFNNPKLAYEAYCKTAIKYHGEFAHF